MECPNCGKDVNGRYGLLGHLKGCPGLVGIDSMRSRSDRVASRSRSASRSASESAAVGPSDLALQDFDEKERARSHGELADTLEILERINAREAERNAAERRTREAAAAQAQEERRRREAHEARVKTGTALLDKSLEGTPGLGPWSRYAIRTAGAAALERSSSSEPVDAVVDEILRVQLRLHAPPPAPPTQTAVTQVPPSTPAPAPQDDATDEVDDDELDDEEDDEVCDDPNCKECAPAAASGSGWGGLLLALGGLAILALAKPAAAPQPAAPPVPPSAGGYRSRIV